MTATAKRTPAKKTAAKRTPAKKTTVAKVSTAADFKKLKKGTALQLPSGLVVVARRVDVKDFLLNNHDVPNPLMETITQALDKGQKVDVNKMAGVDQGEIDMKMVAEMYDMVDTVVRSVVLEPQIHPNPTSRSEEDENLVYNRDVDDEDKMFLFQWAIGGTADIATFRSELASGLAALGQGEAVPSTPK